MIMSNYRGTDVVTHKLKYYCIKKTKKLSLKQISSDKSVVP